MLSYGIIIQKVVTLESISCKMQARKAGDYVPPTANWGRDRVCMPIGEAIATEGSLYQSCKKRVLGP